MWFEWSFDVVTFDSDISDVKSEWHCTYTTVVKLEGVALLLEH